MIVITGANGRLGKAIVESALQRLPSGRSLQASATRQRPPPWLRGGLRFARGDFSDAPSLKPAFAGADQLLIVSADKLGDEGMRLHRIAIEAAREAGVGRILYTSHMGARAGSPFAPAYQHSGTEANLAASGLAYTSLRHGFDTESCLHMIGDALKTDELRVPEDGPVSWTARDDLAEADAAILAEPGKWSGITPSLTASQAVTMAEIAALASEATGREIRHITVPDAEWTQAKVAAGTPAIYAEMLLGAFRAARRGDFAATDPTLETLLGRPPRTFGEALTAAGL